MNLLETAEDQRRSMPLHAQYFELWLETCNKNCLTFSTDTLYIDNCFLLCQCL